MRYCLALDLKDDSSSISEYDRWHQNVWPEILQSLRDSGINSMEIYRAGNRLFMIIETSPEFSFEKKKQAAESNPKVQEWETLMSRAEMGCDGKSLFFKLIYKYFRRRLKFYLEKYTDRYIFAA